MYAALPALVTCADACGCVFRLGLRGAAAVIRISAPMQHVCRLDMCAHVTVCVVRGAWCPAGTACRMAMKRGIFSRLKSSQNPILSTAYYIVDLPPCPPCPASLPPPTDTQTAVFLSLTWLPFTPPACVRCCCCCCCCIRPPPSQRLHVCVRPSICLHPRTSFHTFLDPTEDAIHSTIHGYSTPTPYATPSLLGDGLHCA